MSKFMLDENQLNSWTKPMQPQLYTFKSSGRQAMLKPVSTTSIVNNPNMPNSIENGYLYSVMKETEVFATNKGGIATKDEPDYLRLLRSIWAIAVDAFVDPVIVDNPDYSKRQIALADLLEEELLEVYTEFYGSAVSALVDRFLEKPEAVVQNSGDSE